MSFFQLFRREAQGPLHRLLIMSGLGGASSAAMLATLNAGAQAADSGKVNYWAASAFIIALLLFIKAQRFTLITVAVEIEAMIHKLRVRLLDLVRRSELLPLEAIGSSEIIAAITKDTAALTQGTRRLAWAGHALSLLFFVAIYVAYLSLVAFALGAAIICIAAVLYRAMGRQLAEGKRAAGAWENRLLDRLIDLLDGFKEVRLNRARRDDLFDDIVDVSRTAANIEIRTESETLKRILFARSTVWALLGLTVFVVPAFGAPEKGVIAEITTAIVFVIAAVFGLILLAPNLAAANAAADSIERLEARLERAIVVAREVNAADLPKRFDHIEMRDIVFRYADKSSEAGFQVGPLDFSLRSGDLVFITGGNGSGKSTFLKLLAGLYKLDAGEIMLDRARVNDGTRETYRALISAIFSDYHLFQRLYGISADPAEVDRLLAQFRLLNKTRLTDGKFRTIDLSGGQRKRLALIVSLLEQRPILLLDEWAADQDAEFRRRLYDELLPELIRNGATVVAVTQDDRHLSELRVPARRLLMRDGRFVEQRSAESG